MQLTIIINLLLKRIQTSAFRGKITIIIVYETDLDRFLLKNCSTRIIKH